MAYKTIDSLTRSPADFCFLYGGALAAAGTAAIVTKSTSWVTLPSHQEPTYHSPTRCTGKSSALAARSIRMSTFTGYADLKRSVNALLLNLTNGGLKPRACTTT